MRRVLQVLACCLICPLIVSAEADPKYNASFPFRPSNVTGLTELYLWVGSYYNATTKIEFTPKIGSTTNTSVCKNLQGQTFTAEFQSFLAITERGPYNAGSNPVNALLTLWNSGTNLSSLSSSTTTFPWTSSSLRWYLESAPWVLYATNTTTESDSPTALHDIFNLTLSPRAKEAPYNLTGIIKNADARLDTFDLDLRSCNTSIESSQNYMSLIDRDWSNNAGWNWTYPSVDLQFDSQTANFTVNGYAAAFPYWLSSTASGEHRQLGPDEVQGTIKISFFGVIDPYHSDTLVNTSTTPTWLRTVGFGNNSMNIGYDSGALGWPRASHWEATKRHGTAWFGKLDAKPPKECTEPCASYLGCQSVNFHQRTKKCYLGKRTSKPTLDAPSWATA
ncbi:uncharacterized protein N7498_006346 [Penicillium cinerascens]|uniref:Apple domain-containing protein n=1 Tax=Penicillium cinerascens TaxID=70096 RepID=A0A9W9MHZ6_9EURO|nr:uncharacterized protein N7498_006346 [Penicillium cinerascens]KAJ5201683.1 hypothetical protein N7498_006346 [Penicillium cinerascens]